MEAVEDSSDIWVVIDTDHHPALTPTHEFGHALVLLKWETHPVAGGLPVRRVHVKERVRSIVALGTVKPRQVFNVRPGETLPRGGQVLFDAQQVDGRPSGGGTERLPSDFPAESVLLKIVETSSTLDVGQDLGARHLLPLEDLPGAERPFELADELL